MRVAEVVNLKKIIRPCVLHEHGVLLCLLQTQEGYPLVKGDNSQTPTTQVHTFGKQWDLVGDGYQSIQYGAIQ